MRGWVGLCAAATLGLAASSAGATVLFSDNFDGEPSPPGGATLNYSSFANFFVSSGFVDLLDTSNTYGLTGSGNFVDLDGSNNQGGILETIPQFDYTAGQTLRLNIFASGNQRSGIDSLFAGFRFFTPRTISDIDLTGFTSSQIPNTPSQLLLGIVALPSTAPYQTYSISFSAPVSGRVSALVGTGSNDNIGPLLDGVTLVTVPEPAGWMLLMAGFGGLGAALRRRRAMAPA